MCARENICITPKNNTEFVREIGRDKAEILQIMDHYRGKRLEMP